MKLKPWYDVVKPRKDLCAGRVPEAAEFAVHLDHVRDGRAQEEYTNPAEFFTRTFLTKSLTNFAAEVLRRLAGETMQTNAVFHMITQFGGGKTHALTLLYHLARHGAAAHAWPGVAHILEAAHLQAVPQARVAVFVGTEFDALRGRGAPGEPRRMTPWGEIAFQLGGAAAFAALAEHDQRGVAPSGDVVRECLPKDAPCLILMDEALNYIARARKAQADEQHKREIIDQFYNFLQVFTEQIRAMPHVVLAVSLPSMLVEMGEEDQRAFERYSKMLERVGRPILMSAESETSEIIRRRLFDWPPEQLAQAGRVALPDEAQETCRAFSQWTRQHRMQLPGWFSADRAEEAFLQTYPFHPSVISVFERKWQALPRFQRTRGMLRLLALWIAREYQRGCQRLQKDALIAIGSAPLEDADFRVETRSQLGDDERLETPIMTDIAGDRAFATQLDEESGGEITQERLHQKCAAAIFFESNGGMTGASRKEATEAEIRLAVGSPDFNIGHLDTALDGLAERCYYLERDNKRYRFSVSPKLNKWFSDRIPTIEAAQIEERAMQEIRKAFPAQAIQVIYPKESGDIPDRPALLLAVLSPDYPYNEPQTAPFIAKLTKDHGASARTYKNAIIWALPHDRAQLHDTARALLAWQDIFEEIQAGQTLQQLDQAERDKLLRQVKERLEKSRLDLRDEVWRTYRHIGLLKASEAAENASFELLDLGPASASAASSLTERILQQLRQADHVSDSIGPAFLARNWGGRPKEWNTKALRDAFFASPKFPRLLRPETLKETIAKGVNDGQFAYIGAKTDTGDYALFYYRGTPTLHAEDVEFSDETFILPKSAADFYEQHKDRKLDSFNVQPPHATARPGERVAFTARAVDTDGNVMELPVIWEADGLVMDAPGVFIAKEAGEFTVTARVTHQQQEKMAAAQVHAQPKSAHDAPDEPQAQKITRIVWRGSVTWMKWTNLYRDVMMRFVTDHQMDIALQVTITRPEGISPQKIEEMKTSLRELGLPDELER